jgi:hypothetical protein
MIPSVLPTLPIIHSHRSYRAMQVTDSGNSSAKARTASAASIGANVAASMR